jgi:uncharacterized membrane protein YfhO
VAIERYEPHAVDLRLAPSAAGYVVLADPYYPGWRAYVDGVERPIGRANVLFRAVAVPAGASAVQFRFEPGSVVAGAALSGGALLVALATVVALGGAARSRRALKLGRDRRPPVPASLGER